MRPSIPPAIARLLGGPLAISAARPVPGREVVVIVHGTFANPTFPRLAPRHPPAWWDPPSSFSNALDEALARHHSPARCSTPLPDRLRDLGRGVMWRGWSGANSEVERRQGAYLLAEYLAWLQQQDDIARIHVIAHSHGGNVVRRAFRYLAKPASKRGVIVCAGTPFLHFADRWAWRRWAARIHWPMAGVLAACFWAGVLLLRQPSPDQWQIYVLTFVASGALFAIGRYARHVAANSDQVPVVALRFANDEAIQLLRSCAGLVAEPHIYLRDALGGPAARHNRVAPAALGRNPTVWDRVTHGARRAVSPLINAMLALSDWWNGPMRTLMETAARRVPLGCLPLSVLLIAGFRPYRPTLRPFLLSRMPRLDASFFHTVNEELETSIEPVTSTPFSAPLVSPPSVVKGSLLDPELALTFAGGLAAALYYVFYPVDLLLGVPAWLREVSTRFAMLAGIRAAAGTAAGMDMLGAAYRPRRTGTPDGGTDDVVVPPEIEADIERQLADPTLSLATMRALLDPARRSMIPQLLRTIFTDVTLLHAQYYQDPRIVDAIAQCIAGTKPLQWHGARASTGHPLASVIAPPSTAPDAGSTRPVP